MDRLEDILGEMIYRQRDEERRRANMRVSGTVKQVDAAKRRVKVDIGLPGQELLTPWIRSREQNGNFQTHFLPKQGEKVTVVSHDGEISESSIVEPGSYSDDNESPSNRADEGIIRRDQAQMTWRGDRLTGSVGTASFAARNGFARLQVGGQFVTVSAGGIVSSAPITVGPDPMGNG